MATVETRALRKEFTGHTAVDGVDLAIREGEFLVLLGPSGCGKTTLLTDDRRAGDPDLRRHPDRRQSGQRPPAAHSEDRHGLPELRALPAPTVARTSPSRSRPSGLPGESIAGEVEKAAKHVRHRALLQRKPRQLSGGERQRVALARAMVRHPDVFLLDEPLSNLDAKLRSLARDELKQFQRRLGTTTIYVTHDQVEAMGLGDRIAVMDGGKVRQLGVPRRRSTTSLPTRSSPGSSAAPR